MTALRADHPRLPSTRRVLFLCAALAIALATLLAYWPSLAGEFLWDDDQYVTDNAALRSFEGLKAIWSSSQASPQYYPLVFTTFWIEHQLWGLQPLGYRLVNLALHLASALVLAHILVRVRFPAPAALFAAALFALHPVQVESVAWITERKNALSMFFVMLSAACFLRFAGFGGTWMRHDAAIPASDPAPVSTNWPLYALSSICFVCALLSKTTAAVLPPALLVILWWRRALTMRLALLIVPMLVLGAAAGLFTASYERAIVGASGPEWDLTFADRTLIAGRALWHYLFSFVWPSSLTFIYPRWQVDPSNAAQWLAPGAAIIVVACTLILLKRHPMARPTLATMLLFAGALFPALGFLNFYPMRFSFVADHFSYLASVPLLCALGWLLWRATQDMHRLWVGIIAGVPLIMLGVVTHAQARMYTGLHTLWSRTVERNPEAWIAWTALSQLHMHDADPATALAYADRAIAIAPHAPEPHTNRAAALRRMGRIDEAISSFELALQHRADFAYAHLGLAEIRHEQGNLAAAEPHYRAAIAGHPWLVLPHFRLAMLLANQNRLDEALVECSAAVNLAPHDPDLRCFHAALLASLGRMQEACETLRIALSAVPDHRRASQMLDELNRADTR